MQFVSVNFLLFLGILIALYYLLPRKWQWVILLVGSYVFYIFAGVRYLVFIVFTTITTYLVTRYIDRNLVRQADYLALHKEELSREQKKEYRKKIKSKNRLWFIIYIAANFIILFFCKAALVAPLKDLLEGGRLSFLTIGLPMGMSFYMFQSMGYVIDVYRGQAKALANPFKLALFTAFFPQLVQGPISKFEQLKDSLFAQHDFDVKQVSFGLQRILWGFFKKMVIADRIMVAVSALRSDEHTGIAFFILTLFYSVQLYSDFSGGIDIAIGIAQTLGITLPENFIRPFFSKNIAEYWRRWHITLSDWMKNYIFYPITVSQPMLKLSLNARKRIGKLGMRLPIYIGSLLTWLGTGIWHGFNQNFIVWGLLNCFVIILSEELTPLYEKFHAKTGLKEKKGYILFEIVRTFLMMNLIRALDLFRNVGDYFAQVASIFYKFNFHIIRDGTLMKLGLDIADYVILACGVILMIAVSLMQIKGSVREKLSRLARPFRYAIIIALFLVVILMGSYGVGYDASNFIYNQF